MNNINYTKVMSLFIEKVPQKDVILLAAIFAGAVIINHGMVLAHDQ